VPYSPIADGSTLTAAHMLSNIYNQVIAQVTSGTRPSSPAEGQAIYETDTDRVYIYSGSAWVQFGAIPLLEDRPAGHGERLPDRHRGRDC
jgi:hypothetical protein